MDTLVAGIVLAFAVVFVLLYISTNEPNHD